MLAWLPGAKSGEQGVGLKNGTMRWFYLTKHNKESEQIKPSSQASASQTSATDPAQLMSKWLVSKATPPGSTLIRPNHCKGLDKPEGQITWHLPRTETQKTFKCQRHLKVNYFKRAH